MPNLSETHGRRTSIGAYVLIGLGIIVGLVWVRNVYGYLLFHSLVELFSVAVAAGTFMVIWNLRRYFDTGYLIVVGIAFFFAATVDALHTLAYRGMGVFPDAETDLATQLWLVARYLQAAGLVIAPAFARRKVSPGLVFWSFALVTTALLSTVFVFDVFPTAFEEGVGLTPFKVWSEYLISGAMALSLVAVWRYRDSFNREVLWLLTAMIATAVAAELAFTLYTDPYGPWNFIGHLLKVATFFLLYRAIVETVLVKPLDVVVRDLQRTAAELKESEDRFRSTFERATIGIAHVSLDGQWLRLNQRLAEIAGHPMDELRRMRPEDITHPDDRPAELSLIRRILEGRIDEYRLEKRYVRKDGSIVWVEVGRTLLRDHEGSPLHFVATVEDISERKARDEALLRSRDLTDALNVIDLSINALDDSEEITRVAAEEGCRALGAESAAVLMRDTGRWRPGHLYRFPQERVPEHAPSNRAVAISAEDGSPLVVEDALDHELMNADTMRALGIRSLITVPLRFRGEELGVIYFNYHSGVHRFAPADVEFARGLSSSVTLAIENARLFNAQRAIATTLQSAMLEMPSGFPQLEIAHVYRSATELAMIGGDFYDVYEACDDTVAFVLGDVSGKGIDAAALTAMAKSTIRAYAYQDPRPDRVLASANDAIAAQISESRFITAVYGTIHLPSGRISVACAGHPQPLLCRNAHCREDLIESSPPLGVMPAIAFDPFTDTLSPGTIFVIFSDGLIEARNESGFLGERRVREIVESFAEEGPGAVVDALISEIEAHCEGRIDDDVAIIALRYTGQGNGASAPREEG